jgi:hypothetical protein
MIRLLVFALLAPTVAYTALQKKPATASGSDLLGSWANQDDTKEIVHLDAARCVFARVGQANSARFARAKYPPGRVDTYFWAQKTQYAVKLSGLVLSMTELPSGKTKTYRKLQDRPPEVDVQPLRLGESRALPANKVRSVQSELKRRGKLDQDVRTDPRKQNDMAMVDADNTGFVVDLVQKVGWIDAERFGSACSHEAFLIVQHSGNIPLMLAALPPIERDVKAKRVDAQPYALLFDRLRVTLGEKQRYGTQLGTDLKGELLVMPLEDRARVEELRKELGLSPLVEYLKLFEKQTGGKPVRFLDDD